MIGRTRANAVTLAATTAAVVILGGCSAADEPEGVTSTSATGSSALSDPEPTDGGANDGGPNGSEAGGSPDADAEQSTVFNDADVRYATGMITHHEQAVEMSDIILAAPDITPDVTALATDIKAAQGPEIEQMAAWLEQWNADRSAGESEHDTAGHGDTGDNDPGEAGAGDHGMEHDGMMSPGDLDELRAAEGVAASRLFLEQMIVHHEGAVEMARRHLESGWNPDALRLSENVIDDQTTEIAHMRELLAAL